MLKIKDTPTEGNAILIKGTFARSAISVQMVNAVITPATMFPLSVRGSDPGPHLATIMFPLDDGNMILPTIAPIIQPTTAPTSSVDIETKVLCFKIHPAIPPETAPETIAAVIAAEAKAMTVSPGFKPVAMFVSFLGKCIFLGAPCLVTPRHTPAPNRASDLRRGARASWFLRRRVRGCRIWFPRNSAPSGFCPMGRR